MSVEIVFTHIMIPSLDRMSASNYKGTGPTRGRHVLHAGFPPVRLWTNACRQLDLAGGCHE